MASRFKDLDVSVEDFISEQENESTKKKTLQNVAVLQQFVASKNEDRKLEEIPPEELNEYLSEFIITRSAPKTNKKNTNQAPFEDSLQALRDISKRKITVTASSKTCNSRKQEKLCHPSRKI